MKKLFGNFKGLKANQIHRLENLYRRRTRPEYILSPELTLDISRISHEIRRQVGLLLDRTGRILFVIIGDPQRIVIPDTSDFRVAPGRLRGLRCIHTHLFDEPLTRDDLTDLALLRLDLMAVITIKNDGLPNEIHTGHIRPPRDAGLPYQLLDPIQANGLNINCLELIRALETEIAEIGALFDADTSLERALLVSVTRAPRRQAEESMAELKELALSSGIQVINTLLQQRKKIDPRTLMGRGKLGELTILALHSGVGLIIFDQELNASQIRSITNQIDLKVIDRTQLILDIFAQRAQSKEGKLQVELAQMKYLLPRLVTKNTAMSRLTGGIGGRGPGETKLEINRRRVRDRIQRLEKALKGVKNQRKQQRALRRKQGLPVISIVGYTNAGKSTLLNTLTKSSVTAESRLFATLDPSSRRLKFPRDTEVIITDTVGFIRDLPKELIIAFRATLEELENATLLLHVIDISNPRFEDQIKSVQKILHDLKLHRIPVVYVLNKKDRVTPEFALTLANRLKGIPVCARSKTTLLPLIQKMDAMVRPPGDYL